MDTIPADRRPTNHHVVEALTRLVDMLKTDEKVNQDPPHLSHYDKLPSDVTKAYELLTQGTQLVHSTATKYTLVGKIDEEEQKKLGADLLSGCEIIGAATHVLLQDTSGCSRAVRRSAQRATLAILINVIHLAESFDNHTALDANVGAQKTGAVWEACDTILKRLLPQGNRNSIRREVLTWTRDTNDSMAEFQEMIDLGPADDKVADTAVEDEDENFFGGDEQYADDELPVAKACLSILKCSRGTLKLALETFEVLGAKYTETQDQDALDWIVKLHQFTKVVGEGVTDLGSMMYPPMLENSNNLKIQVQSQVEGIGKVHDTILGLEGMSSNVLELAHVLKGALDSRHIEFQSAMQDALR